MNGRVLIQAKRRKMHLAVVYGPGVYASLCDRLVVAEGADVFPFSEAGGATHRLVDELDALTRGRPVCVYCLRMIALVRILEADRWRASV